MGQSHLVGGGSSRVAALAGAAFSSSFTCGNALGPAVAFWKDKTMLYDSICLLCPGKQNTGT